MTDHGADELIKAMASAGVRLKLDEVSIDRAAAFDPDAMFYSPLIALSLLVVADERKTMRTSEAPVWTAATLTEHFVGLAALGPRLERSVVLRRRCVDALVFLENTELVKVGDAPSRVVNCAAQGKKFLRVIADKHDGAGTLVRGLVNAHANVDARGLSLW